MRIMIVDQDWHFANKTREYLESQGNHVVCHQQVEEVLDRAVRWHPDVVMVSTEFREVAGGELMRDLGKVNPSPAVVLTAGLDRFDRAWQAWQHGGHEVLFKPVLHPSELHVTITTALQNVLCPPKRRTLPQPAAMSA